MKSSSNSEQNIDLDIITPEREINKRLGHTTDLPFAAAKAARLRQMMMAVFMVMR